MELPKGSQHEVHLVLDPPLGLRGPGSKLVFVWAIFMNTCSLEKITFFWVQGQVFSQWHIQSVIEMCFQRTTSTTTTTKKQDTESKIKTPNPKTESKIKLPKSQTPKSIKIQDPKSKLQNRDQKASKRVCPTRVCLTSVSARPSAQQLQRLKLLNPLWPFILMCCLPNFFLSSKLRCFTWNFASWLVSPKNQDDFLFLQIHQHSEQNVKLEITQKVCKVWLINVLFPKNLEQKEIDGKKFARVPPRGPFPLW